MMDQLKGLRYFAASKSSVPSGPSSAVTRAAAVLGSLPRSLTDTASSQSRFSGAHLPNWNNTNVPGHGQRGHKGQKASIAPAATHSFLIDSSEGPTDLSIHKEHAASQAPMPYPLQTNLHPSNVSSAPLSAPVAAQSEKSGQRAFDPPAASQGPLIYTPGAPRNHSFAPRDERPAASQALRPDPFGRTSNSSMASPSLPVRQRQPIPTAASLNPFAFRHAAMDPPRAPLTRPTSIHGPPGTNVLAGDTVKGSISENRAHVASGPMTPPPRLPEGSSRQPVAPPRQSLELPPRHPY